MGLLVAGFVVVGGAVAVVDLDGVVRSLDAFGVTTDDTAVRQGEAVDAKLSHQIVEVGRLLILREERCCFHLFHALGKCFQEVFVHEDRLGAPSGLRSRRSAVVAPAVKSNRPGIAAVGGVGVAGLPGLGAGVAEELTHAVLVAVDLGRFGVTVPADGHGYSFWAAVI